MARLPGKTNMKNTSGRVNSTDVGRSCLKLIGQHISNARTFSIKMKIQRGRVPKPKLEPKRQRNIKGQETVNKPSPSRRSPHFPASPLQRVLKKRGRKPRGTIPQLKRNYTSTPRFCECKEIKNGGMVMCDNDICPQEWFHFSCVNIRKAPPKKWYCKSCRAGNSNQVKSREVLKAQLKAFNESGFKYLQH